jgi:hypothetical protein
MIPHHSGAILMCQKATVRDAELQKLCQQIIESDSAVFSGRPSNGFVRPGGVRER